MTSVQVHTFTLSQAALNEVQPDTQFRASLDKVPTLFLLLSKDGNKIKVRVLHNSTSWHRFATMTGFAKEGKANTYELRLGLEWSEAWPERGSA